MLPYTWFCICVLDCDYVWHIVNFAVHLCIILISPKKNVQKILSFTSSNTSLTIKKGLICDSVQSLLLSQFTWLHHLQSQVMYLLNALSAVKKKIPINQKKKKNQSIVISQFLSSVCEVHSVLMYFDFQSSVPLSCLCYMYIFVMQNFLFKEMVLALHSEKKNQRRWYLCNFI
jgi:hypothetical protein